MSYSYSPAKTPKASEIVLEVSATIGYFTPSIPPLFFGTCNQPQCDSSVSVKQATTLTPLDSNASNSA